MLKRLKVELLCDGCGEVWLVLDYFPDATQEQVLLLTRLPEGWHHVPGHSTYCPKCHAENIRDELYPGVDEDQAAEES